MFPIGMFPAGLFPPGMFPPGTGTTTKRGAGGARKKKEDLRPILHFIHPRAGEGKKATTVEKAFAEAAKKLQREAKEAIVSSRIKSGELLGVGEIGKLSDDDLALILLLMD